MYQRRMNCSIKQHFVVFNLKYFLGQLERFSRVYALRVMWPGSTQCQMCQMQFFAWLVCTIFLFSLRSSAQCRERSLLSFSSRLETWEDVNCSRGRRAFPYLTLWNNAFFFGTLFDHVLKDEFEKVGNLSLFSLASMNNFLSLTSIRIQ